jgi:GTPase
MAKIIKKVKPVKKAVKKQVKKTVQKKNNKRQVVKAGIKPVRKMFSIEVALLDKLQNELFNAIAAKPSTMDFDEIRLYIDNVYMTLNKCTTLAKDVKNYLLKKDFDEPITETYNSPA